MTYELRGAQGLKKIQCPICEKADIEVNFAPPIKVTQATRGSAKRGSVTYRTKEKYEVLSGCMGCGATKKQIEEKLNNPSSVPTKNDVIERLKKAGLPTKF